MYDQYESAQAAADRRFERLPVCDICHQPITDEYYYDIFGDKICPDCIDGFRVDVEEYLLDREESL